MTSDFETYIDITTSLIGLPVAPEHRAAVAQTFAGLMEHARLVLAEPLAPRDEPAEVFTP